MKICDSITKPSKTIYKNKKAKNSRTLAKLKIKNRLAGTCKYCGNDAGWFSHSHKECKEKHEQGVNADFAPLCFILTLRTTAGNVQQSRLRLKKDAYLSMMT